MSSADIRAELMRRWRDRVCEGNPDGAAVGDGAALLFMEMIMDAQELFTRSTFDHFTPITPILPWSGDGRDAIAAGLLSPPGRNAETAAASCPTPKPLATEAGAVLVAWLPGFEDPIGWWHDDNWDAFLDALADENRAIRRQYHAADNESDFRAAVRIEAVKP